MGNTDIIKILVTKVFNRLHHFFALSNVCELLLNHVICDKLLSVLGELYSIHFNNFIYSLMTKFCISIYLKITKRCILLQICLIYH